LEHLSAAEKLAKKVEKLQYQMEQALYERDKMQYETEKLIEVRVVFTARKPSADSGV
jgi:hypothetical protein